MEQLGKYRIETLIGSGAYAEVYRATDTVLKRPVALKVLKPRLLGDEEAFARFLQEAQTAAGLFHPHIATVLDLGEAGGRYFIAVRYVDGPSLDKVLAERGALPWEEALQVTEQIAGALQFAHAKGLVHRDVKPGNILVSESEGAVLTDFGLVKAMASSGMTTTGAFLGTPHYMAPEIWRDEPVGPATDQYALACVVAEMLTGQVLFDGKTPPAVMAKHFQPPGFVKPWPDDVPTNIEEVLARALSQEPGERHADLSEFATVLKPDKSFNFKNDPKTETLLHPGLRKTLPFVTSGVVTLNNPAGIEWVDIPAGKFLYGDKKKPVYIRKPFQIGKYPVTNKQYKRFLDAHPIHKAPSNWEQKSRMYPPGKEDHPVVNVSWHDAQAFCKWARCRLPTEEEWEKASRGPDGRTYPWGDEWMAGKHCNSREAKVGCTTPVDEFMEGVSVYGTWDMSGNVWEWTVSQYDNKTYVRRGGSWVNSRWYVRSAHRLRVFSDDTGGNLGFRCARSINTDELMN